MTGRLFLQAVKPRENQKVKEDRQCVFPLSCSTWDALALHHKVIGFVSHTTSRNAVLRFKIKDARRAYTFVLSEDASSNTLRWSARDARKTELWLRTTVRTAVMSVVTKGTTGHSHLFLKHLRLVNWTRRHSRAKAVMEDKFNQAIFMRAICKGL